MDKHIQRVMHRLPTLNVLVTEGLRTQHKLYHGWLIFFLEMSYQRYNCSKSTGLTEILHEWQQQYQTCARHAHVKSVRSNKVAHRRPAVSSSATAVVEAAVFTSVVAALANSYRPCGWSDQRLVSVSPACLHIRTALSTATRLLTDSTIPLLKVASAQIESMPADHLPDSLQVQQSVVHDRGVFAKCPISEGTVLGYYPGVKRSTPHMIRKISRHPRAKAYAYCTEHGWYLDPSDSQGNPVEGKLWGIADTTMAFVNEPPPGSGTNVSLEDGAGRFDVVFVASREIYASEELYVDYGKFYDRSDYNSS